ncbi:MAG: ORC1-type DNA replication protein [Candidatus Bathyarchaeia archaeon]
MDSGKILDGVFDRFVCEAKIFVDREVLRHDYIPERLPHREDQIRQIGEIVAPALTGARSSNILIYGKTGTGKTAVTKYVLGHLETKAKEFNAPIRVCYVNCRMTGSEYRVFASLCQSMGLHVPFTGLAVGEVFERFRAGLNAAKTLFIVVLDEVDALVKNKSDEFLYELARINETLNGSKLSIVGISNDLRLKEFLDPRVLSSLSEEEIVFRPYDAGELKHILAERAASGFRAGALSDAALNLCSALAAAEHGDARRALDLLRVAGEVAERKGASVVTEEHVREAEKHIEHNRVVDALKNLTLHSKLVMLSVYHLNKNCARRAVTGEIYEVYMEVCSKIGVSPLTQRRFSTIVNELDTMGLLNAKVVSMGRYGRTKKIGLEVSVGLVKSVFSEDTRLGALVECELSCLAKEKR